MDVPTAWASALLELSMESNTASFWRRVCDLLHRVAPHRLAVVSSNETSLVLVRDESGRLSAPAYDTLAQGLRSGSLYNELVSADYTKPLAHVDAATLARTSQGAHPLVRTLGCDQAHTLAFLDDQSGWIQASIVLYAHAGNADQDAAARLQLERLQPLLGPLVSRHMDALQRTSFLTGVGDFLRSLPVGLVFMNWQQALVFVNDEGYRQAHRWNTAPDTRPVKDLKARFSIADDLHAARCELREAWIHSAKLLTPMARTSVTVTHARVLALKATVGLVLDPTHPLTTPNFVIRYAGVGGGDMDAAFQPSEVQLSVLIQLTPAERSVAVLVMQGLDNQAIAAHLHREVSTVKDHLTRVYAKLGLRSRSQLASLAQMR